MSVFTGLDIHKEYHHATAIDEDGGILRQERFPNSLEDMESFFADIESGEVALEASYFWEPVYDELEEMGFEVKLAHPRKTRVIADEKIKTDYHHRSGRLDGSQVAKTYFQRKDIEDMFHLTKKALIVPVEPPYVKEDHLIRAHLFLIFVGLLCHQHIKRKLPDTMTNDEIKAAMEELDMVISTEDETLQFRLANLNEKIRQLLTPMNLEQYLPE
ncbi:hypothetical protein AKJ52_00120 [candidate division MSBL1 archaeon SCGC-AAA382C18]|uniref:Transposase IS110-like N-terminal domain-containing protein n=1 Tax=candidate division MSBL1 archaeon SCGC-AAA382C18 TaxID=1698281 RepID=A0A133VM65_9EURY|nr:hypothetical protein AKJ52_00120 [candidate division MSBL1 archaeon SCGC-AAA382C18]